MNKESAGKLSKVIITSSALVAILGWSSQKAVAAPLSVQPGYNVSVFAPNPAGSSAPDSITVSGNNVFIGYGDFHAPDGSDSLNSTVVEYSTSGQLLNSFTVPGHNDGLRVNPTDGQLWALSNEDANPILTIINPSTGGQTQYTFPSPTPHGGGYDDLAFLNGQVFISASNPASDPNTAPAVASLTLPSSGNTVQLTPVLAGNAQSFDKTTNQTVSLNLQDPDSLGITPQGALTLDGQSDQQLVFIQNPGTTQQQVSNIDLTAQVDDTVNAPTANSFLLVADTGKSSQPENGAVYKISGNFTPGTTYAAENQTGQVGILDPGTGQLTPLATGFVSPHGAGFVSTTQSVPEPDSVLGMLVFGGVLACFKLSSSWCKRYN
ncbi:MAG: hypothetical protein JOZ78_09235 [Chroococcidiopsidaceae cyanobacterium CP_BM_ER_R8_30]|nr:hypothetical protein [Chroococcidiopsidaceae cyanobacterium CP_BM_ER_R8_30]